MSVYLAGVWMLVCSYSSYPRGWALLPLVMAWGPALQSLVSWDDLMISLNLSIARTRTS